MTYSLRAENASAGRGRVYLTPPSPPARPWPRGATGFALGLLTGIVLTLWV